MSSNRIDIVDEIKSRCNIIDVIGRVVPLKKAGNNYKGICPFHNEKTPSFVVSESKQIFTCFGCGATGDVLSFAEKYYNLEFRGAVEMLAKEYGISLDGAFRTNEDREELYDINRQAARFFFKAMREKSNPGYAYMKERGISEDTLNRFGIGYADEEWRSLHDFLIGQGVPREKLLELGLISESKGRYYDKFRGRVIFPIMNTTGKVIGFGGRVIGDGEPKYLNSQESDVFRKKYNLYGLNLTRGDVSREDAIILVEGYMDVVSLYQAGVRNVSASLGTALTENQAKLIKRYTRNVILSYDADQAGQNAAFRGLDILYRGCRARVLKVSDGKDPDEFIKSHGRKEFLELVDRAEPYGDFKLNAIRAGYDMEDEQQRVDFIREAVGILRSMSPVEAEIYIKKLASGTGISERAIRFEYAGNNNQERTAAVRGRDDRREKEASVQTMSLLEQDLIKLMLLDEKYMAIPDDLRGRAFSSEEGKNIYEGLQRLDGVRPIDGNRLRDMLDEGASSNLDKIEQNIIPSGREDEIFGDCIRRIRRDAMKQEEEELITRISMADEDENEEEILKLTQQLMKIQEELKK